MNTPVEALEHAYPVRLLRYSLRPRSGGKGKFHGGDGVIRELRFLTKVQVTVLSDRRKFQPYGLQGGDSGLAGKNIVVRQDGRVEDFPSKFTTWLEAGDVLSIQSPGGGGWGRA
jgi:N-methylhydantoinase B